MLIQYLNFAICQLCKLKDREKLSLYLFYNILYKYKYFINIFLNYSFQFTIMILEVW